MDVDERAEGGEAAFEDVVIGAAIAGRVAQTNVAGYQGEGDGIEAVIFGAGHVGFAVALGLLVTDLPELGTGSIAVDDGGDGRKQVCTRRLGGDNGVFRNEVDQGFPPSWVVIADDDVGPVARVGLAIRWREGDV